MKRIIAFILCAAMIFGALVITASAEKNNEDVVILYENDVHCQVEGYSKLSAMKKELSESYAHVGVVSSGDYIQGSSLGVASRGEYIIELMNAVGYDALTIGNHEFDYHLSRLDELVGLMDTKPVCCNFGRVDAEDSYYQPYSIVSYGEVDIAYIGITTPTTVSSTSPAQFKDEDGNYIFTFHPNDLYEVVQKNIDSAISEGADYVIALSHIGEGGVVYDVNELIANTEGLDVVLDGHSHSVIEGRSVTDRSGREVLLSSTGTKLEYIGKLTVSEDGITTELIKAEDYSSTDPVVDALILAMEEDYSIIGDRKVGESLVHLITHDKDGNRLVRVSETNLSNLCAEAMRWSQDADIGYINGGGLRSDIPAGDISFNDLLSVFPFNNTVVLGEIDGRTLRDMLEMALLEWPQECSFPHTSGITFSVNTSIPSSVVVNESEEFVGISGPYRVYDIKVMNRETGVYEPIDLDRTYTIASNKYYLVDHGSGMTMLENVKVLRNDGALDVEVLERYITEELGGVIGEEFAETKHHISFTDGELYYDTDSNLPVVIAITAVALVILTVSVTLIRRKRRS